MVRYSIILLLLGILLSATGYYKFYHNHNNLPNTCDEYGYLRLAEAFHLGQPLLNHSSPENIQSLIDTLKVSGIQFEDYGWMINPIAYHLDDRSYQIHNQYPPGTSWLLSFFGLQSRQHFFPSITIFLFMLFPVLALIIRSRKNTHQLHQGTILIIALTIFSMVSSPFMTEFTRINSVAPTYGLLLAAGIFLPDNPRWSIIFIAATIPFRVANIILIAPVVGWYMYKHLSDPQLSLKQGMKRIVLPSVITICLSLPYFIYAYWLTGNPFHPTYYLIDRQFATWSEMVTNAAFYFSFDQSWWWLHLIITAILGGLFWGKRISKTLLILSLIIIVSNYLFFLTHKVPISYYPYASAIIVLGMLIHLFNTQIKVPKIHYSTFALIIIMPLFFVVSKWQSKNRTLVPMEKQIAGLSTCFQPYDLVWADEQSGTIEYATGIPTFKYDWGTRESRNFILNWMLQQKYRQAIWLDDLKDEKSTVTELHLLGFTTQLENCEGHRVLRINGKEN